jgi:hypothetical protein
MRGRGKNSHGTSIRGGALRRWPWATFVSPLEGSKLIECGFQMSRCPA